jgi:hypothetical protein
METKKCNKCGEVKSQSDFYKDKATKDGLKGYCKVCRLENIKKYQANPNSTFNSWGAGVYAIIRKSDCKTVYVGETSNLYRRKLTHFTNCDSNKTRCSWIKNNNLNPNDYEFTILNRIEDPTWRKRLENIYIETLGLPQKLNVL